MPGVNKVIIVGRLGQDPELRHMNNGDAFCNLSVATSEEWKDNQGQKQERTEWHRIVIFRKLAEIAGQYLKKGSQVYLEGKLQTRKWQDQNGNDRYSTEVVLNGFDSKMQMLDSKQDSATPQQNGGYQQQAQQQSRPMQNSAPPQQSHQPQQGMQPQQPMQSPVFDADIPF